MNKRKLEFIEAGMKLFAVKGYHNTTIEEIAIEANMSKGSFYLHFESKEQFLSVAYNHFYAHIIHVIEEIEEENLLPKENLAKQITAIIQYIDDYKDFIIMQIRDNVSIGKDFGNLLDKVKTYNFNWLKNHVLAIYEDDIGEYLIDAVIQLDGLLNGYYKWVVVNQIDINKTRTGHFVVERLDDIVRGMLKGSERPLTKADDLSKDDLIIF